MLLTVLLVHRMASAPPPSASAAAPGATAAPNGNTPAPALPQLGALEEDDEFEEFPAEGARWSKGDARVLHSPGVRRSTPHIVSAHALRASRADWNEAEEEQKDRDLWEDNWDDDNVEDDFSVQLRAELEKQGVQAPAGAPASGATGK